MQMLAEVKNEEGASKKRTEDFDLVIGSITEDRWRLIPPLGFKCLVVGLGIRHPDPKCSSTLTWRWMGLETACRLDFRSARPVLIARSRKLASIRSGPA